MLPNLYYPNRFTGQRLTHEYTYAYAAVAVVTGKMDSLILPRQEIADKSGATVAIVRFVMITLEHKGKVMHIVVGQLLHLSTRQH